jgi:hypothetical protein
MENTIETQPHLVWELVRLANMREYVVCSIEQTAEEYEVDGRGDALANLLPLELLDSANDHGEWHEEGLLFTHEGQQYLVRCKQVGGEESLSDPIPEPLSLGCGLRIDAVSDRMESPTWYVGIYDGETGDWLGEVPIRCDPTRAPALVESLVDQILRIYPEDRLPIGRAELARRIRMVFESVREGDPRPYPEIEREEGA